MTRLTDQDTNHLQIIERMNGLLTDVVGMNLHSTEYCNYVEVNALFDQTNLIGYNCAGFLQSILGSNIMQCALMTNKRVKSWGLAKPLLPVAIPANCQFTEQIRDCRECCDDDLKRVASFHDDGVERDDVTTASP